MRGHAASDPNPDRMDRSGLRIGNGNEPVVKFSYRRPGLRFGTDGDYEVSIFTRAREFEIGFGCCEFRCFFGQFAGGQYQARDNPQKKLAASCQIDEFCLHRCRKYFEKRLLPD